MVQDGSRKEYPGDEGKSVLSFYKYNIQADDIFEILGPSQSEETTEIKSFSLLSQK